MWTRAELKNRAKAILKTSYWKAFLASLVIMVAGSAESQGPDFEYRLDRSHFQNGDFSGMLPDSMPNLMPIIGFIGLGIFLAVIAYRIFIGYPLEVGGRRYFVEASEGRVELGNLGRGFNGQWYGNLVKTMLLRGLAILGWTLLLVIPGIIKMYAYRFVPYILAENPGIDSQRARQLSNQMTLGHKGAMFVLDLSFLGWYILGALALGIGILFVHPYVNTTFAELYQVLKAEALSRGDATAAEFTNGPQTEWSL